ncbi:MAG: hypothetical protein J6W60_01135 [Treponema sp.]|nr:hypothetical protein [Treponema sp.]
MEVSGSLDVTVQNYVKIQDPRKEFKENLINHLEKVQSESSTNLATRITLNISREELDYIVYLLRKIEVK